MELKDVLSIAVAFAGVALVWLQMSRAMQRDREETRRAMQSERETRAEERGAFQQWQGSVNARLDSRREEYEQLKEQIKVDHGGLRERVDLGFNDTDGMITGVRDMLTDMRGELRGAGVLSKK